MKNDQRNAQSNPFLTFIVNEDDFVRLDMVISGEHKAVINIY